MKKITFITIIALTLGVFQACKSNKDKTTVVMDTVKKESSTMATDIDTAFAKKPQQVVQPKQFR